MTLTPGGRLGPYEIVDLLGVGGMGEVYRARDTRLDRQVAIKVLPAEMSGNAQFRLRLEREARLISQLNHPNICTLHDVGHDDSRDYLVMEYLEGETLAERLVKGRLPMEQVIRYATEIADALDRAHRQGIVHRDLKPSNVMITKSGVKLLDFGLAKSAGGVFLESSTTNAATLGATQQKDHSLTKEGTIVGTFQYMAPEQLEGLEADARTDIFAFGCVLYEMVTGRRAFEGTTRTSLIAAIVATTPRPISETEPLTPPALDHIVRKCLEKDPDKRWQSAHDIAGQLRWIGEAGSQAGAPVAVVVRRKTRERLAWSVAAIMTLLVLAAAAVAWKADRPQPLTARFGVLPPEGTGWTPFNSLSISPDGRYLVFFAAGKDPRGQLYLRRLDSMEAEPIPGAIDASFPFWSPDSRSFAFFVPGKMKKIDIGGGSPVTLADVPDGRGGSWGRDGWIIFAPKISSEIHKVPAVGGIPEPIRPLDAAAGETAHRWPRFLPDGKRFIYRSVRGDAGGIWVGSLDPAEAPRKLLDAEFAEIAPPNHLIFTRERAALGQKLDMRKLELVGAPFPIAERVGHNPGTGYAAIAASDNGVLVFRAATGFEQNRLVWLDREGREIAQISDGGIHADPVVSPDGKRIAIAILDELNRTSDIWVIDAVRGTRSRITFGPEEDFTPVWSPDGSRIAYASGSEGSSRILERLASGAGEERVLVEGAGNNFPTGFTQDGRYLAFARSDRNFDVLIAPTDGSGKSETFLATPFNESEARFAPNGKWIAYSSDESGRPEIYLQTFPASGGKWQISTGGGRSPRWRHDGKELYYLDLQDQLVAVAIDVTGGDPSISIPAVLFQANLGGPSLLWDHYDVAADGRFVFDVEARETTQLPITVALGWGSSLR